MTVSSASAVPPQQSRALVSEYALSRIASALRLTVLVVITGLLVAFITAGVFAALSLQLTHAMH